MNTRPQVSIIIPLYNVEKFVVRSLESAFAQDYDRLEWILVDDRGTDGTIPLVRDLLATEKYRGLDARIVTHDVNRGLSEARNAGVAAATGDFCYFMDSDDTITPHCISQHVDRLTATGADFTCGDFAINGVAQRATPAADAITDKRELIRFFTSRTKLVSACNKLLPRKILLETPFLKGLIHEDELWAIDFALKCNSCAFVAEAGYDYFMHEGSITHSVSNHRRRIESRDTISRLMLSRSYDPANAPYADLLSARAMLGVLYGIHQLVLSSLPRAEKRRFYRRFRETADAIATPSQMKKVASLPYPLVSLAVRTRLLLVRAKRLLLKRR